MTDPKTNETNEADPLWTPKQVAAHVQCSTGWLANARSTGTSPIPYCTIGSRVRYRRSDVHAYIESRMVHQ